MFNNLLFNRTIHTYRKKAISGGRPRSVVVLTTCVIHIHIYICIYMYRYVYVHICIYVYVYIHIYMGVYTHVFIKTNKSMNIHMYTRSYLHHQSADQRSDLQPAAVVRFRHLCPRSCTRKRKNGSVGLTRYIYIYMYIYVYIHIYIYTYVYIYAARE